eukprot:SAG25_NODE_1036_length_4212_cov_3.356917_6_plen_79_part_00
MGEPTNRLVSRCQTVLAIGGSSGGKRWANGGPTDATVSSMQHAAVEYLRYNLLHAVSGRLYCLWLGADDFCRLNSGVR